MTRQAENDVVAPKVTWTELRPIRLSVACPRGCGGEMKVRNGSTQGTGPTHWRHECDRCNTVEWYADAYPTIVYKTVEVR